MDDWFKEREANCRNSWPVLLDGASLRIEDKELLEVEGLSLRRELVFRGPTVALSELFMRGALTWTVLLETTEASELRLTTAGTEQYDRFPWTVLLGCMLCSKKEVSPPLDCGGSDRLSDTFDDFTDFVSTSSILPLKLIE